jgi:hypothetical protein
MTNVKFLSTDDFRRLISEAKHHRQMLRALLLHSMAAQRCSAPLPWERGDATKPRPDARQRRKRGDV